MRTAYLGTSEFAATVLRRLAESPHSPALVVTPPDSRSGQGPQALPAAGRRSRAPARAWSCTRPPTSTRTESLTAIRAARPEAIVVCAFGQLIKEPLLSEFLMLNVHPSLIPRWRGAAPIERTLMAGRRHDRRHDHAGDRRSRFRARSRSPRRCRSRDDDDYAALSARLADLSGELVVRALDALAVNELEFVEQDEAACDLCREDLPGGAPPRPGAQRDGARADRRRTDPAYRRLPRAG